MRTVAAKERRDLNNMLSPTVQFHLAFAFRALFSDHVYTCNPRLVPVGLIGRK